MAAKYTSNNVELKKTINSILFNIADALSKDAEATVKEEFTEGGFYKTPVATGTLRRSVAGKVKTNINGTVTAEVRTDSSRIKQGQLYATGKTSKTPPSDVSYAKFVEYGTVKMPARPFMAQGMAKANARALKIIRAILR